MTTIGHFRRDGEGFAGRLTTLGLEAKVRLAPAEKFSNKAPDYLALVGECECECECGAGLAGDGRVRRAAQPQA